MYLQADYITPRIGYPNEVDLEAKVNKKYERVGNLKTANFNPI